METFSLSGTDLSGHNVDMSKSFPMKIIGGLVGAHPNLPNIAGSPMDTNSPQKKNQGQTNNTHNGDVNQTGMHADNMTINSKDGEEAARTLNQQLNAQGDGWDRFPSFP